MEFIIELILEIALVGGMEASKSSKIPKPVRYIIIALISLFFISVVGVLFWAGILVLSKSIVGGIVIMLIGGVFLFVVIDNFVRTYINRRSN